MATTPCPECHDETPRYSMGYYKAYGFYIRCTKCGKYIFTDEDINVVRKELDRLNGRDIK